MTISHQLQLVELITDAVSGFASGRRDDSGLLQIRMNNVTNEGYLDLNDVIRVPASARQLLNNTLVPGDIVFNCTNSVELVGKSALFTGHSEEVAFSNHFLRLRPNKQKVVPAYLARWLCHQYNQGTFRLLSNRWVNQATVPRESLLKLRVPLPPLAEQERIVSILDKADTVRRNRQLERKLSDELLRSVFLETFGDPVANPKGLSRKPIKELGEVITGNTPPREKKSFYGDHIEWIKSDNINTPYHFVTRASEALSEEGKRVGRTAPAYSVLVSCIAGSPECIGNAAITDREVAFNQQINAIKPFENTDPFFLYTQLFVSKKLVQRSSTNSMKGMVSKSKFEEISLLAPAPKKQRAFGEVFKKLHDICEKFDKSKDQSNHLFESLRQRAFRGEL